MIYSIDGKLVKIDGNLLERRVKSLTFQMKGEWFPQSFYDSNNVNYKNGNETFKFRSTTPNSVTVNYGDGQVITKDFTKVDNFYEVGYSFRPENDLAPWRIEQHTYTDGFEGLRNITFEFENELGLDRVESSSMLLYGQLPIELTFFRGLDRITIARAKEITSIPDSFPPNLTYYSIANSLKNKLTQLPDSLFNTDLITLTIDVSYNLSDNISSNFFKINQLSSTLTQLQVSYCNIVEFPESLKECIKINNLQATDSLFEEIPTEVNSLVNLTRLYLGSTTLTDTSMPYWDNLKDLRSLVYGFPQADLSDMPEAWSKLYSLIGILSFNSFINTSARFDEFIDNFYELCTVNGTILGDAPAPYPNRFRNIAWGFGTLSFTGSKVAPTGYVQGVSNGTPATQGEKAYVLQNQYNHTITHA